MKPIYIHKDNDDKYLCHMYSQAGDYTKTGFGFVDFMHFFCKPETSFAKPSGDGFTNKSTNCAVVYLIAVHKITSKKYV